jgi:hypothetical protein
VPASYGVCPHDATLERAGAPETVVALVTKHGTETTGTDLEGKPWQPDGCRIVPVDVAHEIVVALDAAGHRSNIFVRFPALLRPSVPAGLAPWRSDLQLRVTG